MILFFYFRDGLPTLRLPPFSTELPDGRHVSFIEMCSDLGSSIFIVPVIAVLGNVAIAKAFGKLLDKNIVSKPSTISSRLSLSIRLAVW